MIMVGAFQLKIFYSTLFRLRVGLCPGQTRAVPELPAAAPAGFGFACVHIAPFLQRFCASLSQQNTARQENDGR